MNVQLIVLIVVIIELPFCSSSSPATAPTLYEEKGVTNQKNVTHFRRARQKKNDSLYMCLTCVNKKQKKGTFVLVCGVTNYYCSTN